MTKSELIIQLASENPHLYQRDIERIVNAIFDEIAAALSRKDRVELRGFGAFSVKNRSARKRRNQDARPRIIKEPRGPASVPPAHLSWLIFCPCGLSSPPGA